MGKISLVSAKYIIHASIDIKGAVDKPDVIGAIFGQTEGLLGSDLELRELQKSGRIGRIEVNVDTKSGRTMGAIIIPSSLDKSETSIVGAALEIIERIGPCDAKIKVERIEDVRISKRAFVVERAKELLKHLQEEVLPESEELAEEVSHSIRQLEIQDYGTERLPAGPAVDESEEVYVVEGRADVLTLLKHGIKNTISMNGTSVPETIKRLGRNKVIIALVDGDRGGDLIIRELEQVAELDYYAKAPLGKEIEELTKKELFTVLSTKTQSKSRNGKKEILKEPVAVAAPLAAPARIVRPVVDLKKLDKKVVAVKRAEAASPADSKEKLKSILEDLVGTRAAVILDSRLDVLGKVPVAELSSTIKNIEGIHAVVFDGEADANIVDAAERSGVAIIVAMDTKGMKSDSVKIISGTEL
jgi:DNA primase